MLFQILNILISAKLAVISALLDTAENLARVDEWYGASEFSGWCQIAGLCQPPESPTASLALGEVLSDAMESFAEYHPLARQRLAKAESQ